MKAIDRAHRSLERNNFRAYQEEISPSEIRKALLLMALYIACLVMATACFVMDAMAQDINNLEPNSSISTDSPDVVVIKTPTEQEAESPSMNVYVKPQPPYISPDSLSPEFVANLIAGQLKNAVARGILPADIEIKRFTGKRSAQEDLEFYALSIMLHQRAIKEGRDVNYYLDQVSAGKIPVARLKRDIEVCNLGFEIYPNSGICSQFKDHQETEQHYYHCQLENTILKAELIKVTKPAEPACDDKGWSRGNKWKPQSDTRPNQGVILLDTSYCDGQGNSLVSNIRIEDSLGGIVSRPSFDICNKSNGGRSHHRFAPSGTKMSGPLFVRYQRNGVEECRRVADPSREYE